MSIAIIGSGITGLAVASELARNGKAADITVFESAAHLGGHAWTMPARSKVSESVFDFLLPFWLLIPNLCDFWSSRRKHRAQFGAILTLSVLCDVACLSLQELCICLTNRFVFRVGFACSNQRCFVESIHFRFLHQVQTVLRCAILAVRH